MIEVSWVAVAKFAARFFFGLACVSGLLTARIWLTGTIRVAMSRQPGLTDNQVVAFFVTVICACYIFAYLVVV